VADLSLHTNVAELLPHPLIASCESPMAPHTEKKLAKSTLLELITPNYCTDSLSRLFLFPGTTSCPAVTTIAEILNSLQTGRRLMLRVHWAVATLLHFHFKRMACPILMPT
jgi:hypothetical protein